jgi:hypothetical protein
MSSAVREDVDVMNLIVNIENPRYEMVGTQREAISIMIEDQKDKLVRLAEDIIENGLNPSDLVIVARHEKEANQYNVLEGNRRVTVLKLLNSPELISEKYKSLYKKFKQLSENFVENPIEKIPCVIFEDEKLAHRWIRLKHTGENQGVGTVSWNAQQVARFEERIEGRASFALQAIDFLKKDEDVSNDLKNKLREVPSSSLQRLLTDPDIRNVLGVGIDNGRLVTFLEKAELIKGLTKVINDLTRDDFTVKEIYYKDDRLNYIETFKPTELPDKANSHSNKWELIDPSQEKEIDDSSTSKRKKSKHLSTTRNSIIPKSCVIHISEPRINKIYRELKDLDLRYFCNTGSIAFRVFVELSLDCFIEKFLPNVHIDSKLKIKVEATSRYMVENKIIDQYVAKPFNTAISSPNSILSINTLNAYVHNKQFSPSEKDLKIAWDNYQPFLMKLWEQI